MDFSKFRESGDLSDLTVVVNGVEFKLHKFPLYAKSEYFCKIARSADMTRIDLEGFPGGPDIFSLVADFCYNMQLNITKNNIVQIRCAADFLIMTGPGNLVEVSDKFLQDTITSVKMSRSTSCISSLLMYSSAVGELANQCGIVSSCCDALIECWLKPPTKFSSPTNIIKQGSLERREDKTVIALMSLPLEWFVKMIKTARERGVRTSLLAELATSYIAIIMDREEAEERQSRDTLSTPIDLALEGIKSQRESKLNTEKDPNMSRKSVDLGTILDSVLHELPEEALYDNVVTIDWLTRVIRVATSKCCNCRRDLVKAAGELLSKLSAEDLCIISPSLLHDIVIESCSSDNGQAEKACRIVDTYMAEMVRKRVLTAETFKLLATAVPKDARSNHDQMYNILEYVLTAEKDRLTGEQRQELIATVNFKLLNEETLQVALTSEIVPHSYVASGAISLCGRLRSELENLKTTVQRQEDEIKRLQNAAKKGKTRGTPIMTSAFSHGIREPFSSGTNRDSELAEFLEPTKDIPSESQQHQSTSDVLSAVRNKLASSTSSSSSPYNTFRPVQSSDHDTSYDDELEFKYDRGFKPLDNTRPKNRQHVSYGSYFPSYSYSHHRF